jgi:tRNA threonylcarbamoyladenosine biosynthesis protein TsaB
VRILALETSGLTGSVATLEDDRILTERELEPTARTARTLVPEIHELLRMTAWKPADIELVAVTSGPGSFTGLRIGVMAAKTISYATGGALVGVNALSVVASQARFSGPQLWAVMNAERDQLFAAAFLQSTSGWTVDQPTKIVDRWNWLAALRQPPAHCANRDANSAEAMTAVTGPGLCDLLASIPPGIQVLDESSWAPRAAAVGREGWRAYRAGYRSDCWQLVPQYFRDSAAEEKSRGSSAS